ncbi:MAG: HD domain-containing protein [Lachnospiraceae bacterium]|nr:HD domain-containing protein [Lachnospiraceae bacterium]
MIINVYTILFFISLIMIVAMAVIGQKQNITYYILLFAAIMISNLGDYAISVSDTMNSALVGQSMVYLGGVFTPILVLFSTMKLCKMKIPTALWSVLVTIASVVMFFVFTVDKTKLYYKSLTLGKANGMTILIKERGPMHNLYMILLFGCVILTLGVSIYSIFQKKNVSYRTIAFLLVGEVVAIASYLIERICGLDFELVPFAYILDEFIFIGLVRKISRYEITESVAESISENSQHGYIVFNEKGEYIGSNETAQLFFPQLEHQRIDSYLTEDKTPVLYEKFVKRILTHGEAEYTGMVEKEGRILKCALKTIHRGEKKKIDGYVVEMQDDTQQQTYLRLLDNYNSDLEKEVREKTEHINLMQEKIVLGMADMIENRDSNTGGHVKRTSAVVRIFTDELRKRSKEYDFSSEFLMNVAKAAPMHDLGKIAVDDRILRKPGRFTDEEFEEMKKHSEKGAEIVGRILEGVEDDEFVQVAKNVAHYHHEKWNGEGYPTGIAGIEIPPEARIMALADVFDALVSKRCYKEKMDYDSAFHIIEESLGSHFDPELGKMFLHCRAKLEAYYDAVE